MKTFQKALVIAGIAAFLIVGLAVMLFLFAGMSFSATEYVGVIDISGEIEGSVAFDWESKSVYQLLEEARDDPSVAAIVLRINSGGGGVIPSKELASAVSDVSLYKPVVTYVRCIAASGAYYVAAHSDYIVSDEDSMVGSVGVLSTFVSYEELLEDKLGVEVTTIKSGEFKDLGSPYRNLTEAEAERVQELVDKTHRRMLDDIVLLRGLSPSQRGTIDEAGIFLGDEALALGLVDSLGSMDSAVEIAGQMADSPKAEMYRMGPSDSGQDIYYSLGLGIGDALAAKLEAEALPELR